MLLSNRSVFYRRFAEAYPEVIFKTERIAKRMEEIRVETERLRQEAEERVAQMRLEVAENLEPTRSVKSEKSNQKRLFCKSGVRCFPSCNKG